MSPLYADIAHMPPTAIFQVIETSSCSILAHTENGSKKQGKANITNIGGVPCLHGAHVPARVPGGVPPCCRTSSEAVMIHLGWSEVYRRVMFGIISPEDGH